MAFHSLCWALRIRATRSLARCPPGSITVVTATWNTLEYLKVCTEMVARHSSRARHLVVDNCSTDGTREWAKAKTAEPQGCPFQYVRLPRNVGHPLALDLGFLLAGSEYVISLDVDAFPFHSGWLDALIQPLCHGAKLCGCVIDNPAISYPYIHPCGLAMRMSDFVLDKATFWPAYSDSDVGAELSKRYAESMHMIPMSSVRGPGLVGSVFGGFLYHNWGSARPGLYETGAEAWEDALKRFVRAPIAAQQDGLPS